MSNSQSEKQSKENEFKYKIMLIEQENKRQKELMQLAMLRVWIETQQKKKEEESKSNGWMSAFKTAPFIATLIGGIGLLAAYTFARRFWSLRYMIQPKKYQTPGWKLTNYHFEISVHHSRKINDSFPSVSGGSGIGKTAGILALINQLSKSFPIFCIRLEHIGGSERIDDRIKEQIKLAPKLLKNSRFLKDIQAFNLLRVQLSWLKLFRDNPVFSFIACLFPLAGPFLVPLIWIPPTIWLETINGYAFTFGSFAGLYLWAAYPFLKYCLTRGIPTVVCDDTDVMALNPNPQETSKCSQFYRLMLDDLANVYLLSSDDRTCDVVRSMPNHRTIVQRNEIKFDVEYTYKQILADEETDFKNLKSDFLSKILLNHKDSTKFLTNNVIRYFVNELKDRELTLRELKQFFSDQTPSFKVFNTFLNKFKEEVQDKTFQTEGLKQEKIKQIVKEACKIYDDYHKNRMIYTMDDIMIIYDKVRVEVQEKQMLNQLIRSLGVEAQKAQMKPFEQKSRCADFYLQFIKYNILKQEKQFVDFESKMKKIAFKLWFEQVGLKQIEKDELKIKQRN